MLRQALLKRQAEGKPIRVGSSGAGWMGSGFVAQMRYVPGMEVTVLGDPEVESARAAFVAAGIAPDRIVETDAPGPAMDALRAGKRVVTGSNTLAAQLEDVDIVADVTWSPAVGAETAFACIRHGKDVVLINIEADPRGRRALHRLLGR
jgi:predicted homoserine dehydrogenase-like protein